VLISSPEIHIEGKRLSDFKMKSDDDIKRIRIKTLINENPIDVLFQYSFDIGLNGASISLIGKELIKNIQFSFIIKGDRKFANVIGTIDGKDIKKRARWNMIEIYSTILNLIQEGGI
jgi:hypothetical protein